MSSARLFLAALGMGLPLGLGAMAQTRTDQQSCVDVQIGSEQYYSCLNKRLQTGIEQHRFTSRDTPYSAASPDPAVNTFNEAATRERLGSAFGHAAIPQRPPPPVFSSPLVIGR